MSKITEYVSLFLKGIPHSMEIANSIVNNVQLKYGNLPEDEKEEIIKRRVICEGCPFMSKHSPTSEEYFVLMGEHYKTSRGAKHCSMCGCGIEMKTASLNSNCGLEEWNRKNPNKPVLLRWNKYKNYEKD